MGNVNTREALDSSITFIEPWLEQRYRDLDWPGFAVTVAHLGDIAFTTSLGFADVPNGEPMSENSIFQAGSQTKPFTSTEVMKLVEADLVSIHKPVADYVPELTDHKDKRWHSVSVEQLLSHGAGVARDGENGDFWELKRSFPNRAELMDTVMRGQLVIGPSEQMKYSNIGYAVLGLLIENVTGQRYSKVIETSIISPLGLKNTSVDQDSAPNGSMAVGHGRKNEDGKRSALPRMSTQALAPAAGLYSTTPDLSRFYSELIPGFGDQSFLLDETKENMQLPRWQVNNSPGIRYSLGFDIGDVGGRPMIGHGGGYPGYMSKTLVDRENGIVVSGMANCIDGDALMMTIGVMEAINHFIRHKDDQPQQPLEHFNARLSGLWKDRQIVVAGNSIVSINPHSWHPFNDAEELQYVDSQTLRLINVNGFEPEGEIVEYHPDRVVFCGRTMQKSAA